MTDQQTVNIPLLRKAVEWAEAEAQKPLELREWEQGFWILTPELRERRLRAADGIPDYWTPSELASYTKAPECGTCYCIAGYVTVQETGDLSPSGFEAEATAAIALGIDDDDAERLFDGRNTIKDVRRIAEEIAGERL